MEDEGSNDTSGEEDLEEDEDGMHALYIPAVLTQFYIIYDIHNAYHFVILYTQALQIYLVSNR